MGTTTVKGASDYGPETSLKTAEQSRFEEIASKARATAVAEAIARTKEFKDGQVEMSGQGSLGTNDPEGLTEAEVVYLLRLFLEDALRAAPLPDNWEMHQDAMGDVYFTDIHNEEESTWEHPLAVPLEELALLFRRCLGLPFATRQAYIETCQKHWDDHLKSQLDEWVAVTAADGKTYYCNHGTQETSWEHPSTRELPGQFLRMKAASWLAVEGNLEELKKLLPRRQGSWSSGSTQSKREVHLTLQPRFSGRSVGSSSRATASVEVREEKSRSGKGWLFGTRGSSSSSSSHRRPLAGHKHGSPTAALLNFAKSTSIPKSNSRVHQQPDPDSPHSHTMGQTHIHTHTHAHASAHAHAHAQQQQQQQHHPQPEHHQHDTHHRGRPGAGGGIVHRETGWSRNSSPVRNTTSNGGSSSARSQRSHPAPDATIISIASLSEAPTHPPDEELLQVIDIEAFDDDFDGGIRFSPKAQSRNNTLRAAAWQGGLLRSA